MPSQPSTGQSAGPRASTLGPRGLRPIMPTVAPGWPLSTKVFYILVCKKGPPSSLGLYPQSFLLP